MAFRHIARAAVGALALILAGPSDRASAQNWDGSGLIRFGVFLQGSFIDYDIERRVALGAAAIQQSATPGGFGVGISAGYDLRLGSFIAGFEADASWDDGSSKSRPNTNDSYGIDYMATLRGRLGYVVHPAFMIYGTLGYGLTGAEYKLSGVAVPTTGGGGPKKYGTLQGFVYGGGMEYDMGWGIGFLEYLHQDFGSWAFTNAVNNRYKLDGSQDVIRLGLKFKVGHDHSHDVYRHPDGLK